MNRMSLIHLWIGKTDKSLEEFEEYFNLDSFYDSEEGEDFEKCGFCREVTFSESYGDDFIGLDYKDEPVSVEGILHEIPSSKIKALIVDKCRELNIAEANAMFYYRDAELPKPEIGRQYNDLFYIGEFQI
ncbi:immunity 22 family protein [Sphingobacterium sp. BIGb0165]|uniref:immunity 22 family protein n=1 Tax=Sphingobacterium sp. BIGb0165 TaxID=2940615 RepID=UPI0021697457|nr:immunity 22 family protein [Sphingobacterium sp. BIGb0165]MCS4225892.1 hypothetical protein [Sphingobacterium sp. BIGb0165]